MMRAGEAPISCAAVVKSSSRSDRNLARTARASPGHSSRPMMMQMPAKTPTGLQVTGSSAESVMNSGISGNERMISMRSEEHTSELQSLMRISYAVFCLKKKNKYKSNTNMRVTKKIIQYEYK